MRLIKTTPTHEIWQSFYDGLPVQFTKNLLTQELHVNAEDLAKVMGFESLQSMMANDEILDCINQVKQETGIWPLSKQNF